jgi:hypothetical protein
MHQSQAHRDKKLKKVLIKYGAQGYGLYWYCIEQICADLEPALTFELEHDSEILAHELRIDTLLVEEMMRYMVEIGLFEESQGVVTCLKLAAHLGDSLTRNQELKAIIQKAKGCQPDNTPNGYVYFMKAAKGVKIGYSANPWSRVKDVRSDIGEDVQIAATVRGTIQDEKLLHQAFKSNRLEGEWFNLTAEMQTVISGISDKKITSVSGALELLSLLRSSDVAELSHGEERRREEKKKIKHNGQKSATSDRVPVQEIVDLYHQTLPELPRIEKITTARRGHIQQRWREDLPSLDRWENFFTFVRRSDFLMGRAEPRPGSKPFRADLEWMTKAGNFAKIAEEKYHGQVRETV